MVLLLCTILFGSFPSVRTCFHGWSIEKWGYNKLVHISIWELDLLWQCIRWKHGKLTSFITSFSFISHFFRLTTVLALSRNIHFMLKLKLFLNLLWFGKQFSLNKPLFTMWEAHGQILLVQDPLVKGKPVWPKRLCTLKWTIYLTSFSCWFYMAWSSQASVCL